MKISVTKNREAYQKISEQVLATIAAIEKPGNSAKYRSQARD